MMKRTSIQQEILLFTNTSFTQRELNGNDNPETKKSLSPHEQLEAACWNGWLDEMMPDIIDSATDGNQLFLWEILQARAFLNIELCESPKVIDLQYSINPYAHLATVCYS